MWAFAELAFTFVFLESGLTAKRQCTAISCSTTALDEVSVWQKALSSGGWFGKVMTTLKVSSLWSMRNATSFSF